AEPEDDSSLVLIQDLDAEEEENDDEKDNEHKPAREDFHGNLLTPRLRELKAKLIRDLLQILPGFALGFRVPQQERRVKRRHESRARARHLVEAASERRNSLLGLEQGLRGELPERDDHLGP